MDGFDYYCCFCSGPLENGKTSWLRWFRDNRGKWPPKDGEWYNPPGYPVPTKPIEEIVRIDDQDGSVWDDWVVVSPVYKEEGWVSPPATPESYGDVEIEGRTDWNTDNESFVRIHRICLSFLCRRLSTTPKEFWESLYSPDSDYPKYSGVDVGLLYCVEYYDMADRAGQEFGYAVQRQTPTKEDPMIVDRWYDPETMEDTVWILSQPTLLGPPSELLDITVGPPSSGLHRLFDVRELVDELLSAIVYVSRDTIIKELMQPGDVSDAPSVLHAVASLLALSQVNRFWCRAIVERQGLFLQLISQFGWMLPSMPDDWNNWPDSLTPYPFRSLHSEWDWKAYLVRFLQKKDRHIRNRWRFHRMTVQFACGRILMDSSTGDVTFRWKVGKLAVIPPTKRPEPEVWEMAAHR